ncbi:hypothetical protein MKW94_001145 [Papaver nudicaule]|uniref:Uncharacterized protein n=1 Tax=Papaver nudicaule TaxID=74823 RepID=A0AA41VJX8_PAPNU|nr:hypothetical protein [Papaver nudicaule]MCL7042681.1 hypothetical protein [Papaver nudicaule]
MWLINIRIVLGLVAGSMWKMHHCHWDAQRKIRQFYNLLQICEIGVAAED